MFPEWTWIIGFWIGACVGSFLNVVIYRLPRGLSVYKPTHSFCPNCKHRLTGPDLVPLFSWLILKRKCRHCTKPVKSRYFWVELVNASLWGYVWFDQLSRPGLSMAQAEPVRAAATMLFCSCLVAAIFTDIDLYVIPDQINAVLLLLGLALNAYGIANNHPGSTMWGMPSSVDGALVGFGVLWGIALLGRLLFRKDAMGHGDIKMARGTGAFLLPVLAGTSFAIAVALGAIFGVAQILARRHKGTDQAESESDDEEYEPESIGSLFWCGLGYLLCIDVIGLVLPGLYKWWFKEDPYAIEEAEDEPEVEPTMIPFGPYLAAGAILCTLFGPFFNGLVENYLRQFR